MCEPFSFLWTKSVSADVISVGSETSIVYETMICEIKMFAI